MGRRLLHSAILVNVVVYLLTPSLGWIAYWVWEEQIAQTYCVNTVKDPGCHGKCFVRKITQPPDPVDTQSRTVVHFLQNLDQIIAIVERLKAFQPLEQTVVAMLFAEVYALLEGHPPGIDHPPNFF